MPFPESFETARLRAERLREEHFALIHAMHQDPVQMAMLGGVRDEAGTAAYMSRNLGHWDEHGFGLWILRDRFTSEVAGRALLRHLTVEAADEVEVGYSLHPAFWARGLATEIASACVDHCRSALALHSIVAVTLPANARSRKVLEKIGMRYERDFQHNGDLCVLYRSTMEFVP